MKCLLFFILGLLLGLGSIVFVESCDVERDYSNPTPPNTTLISPYPAPNYE
jgi:hypothetical protein